MASITPPSEPEKDPSSNPTSAAKLGHIGFVVQHPYPHAQAIRVTKMAASARHAGYEVSIFCPGAATMPPSEDVSEGTIIRLRGPTRGGLFTNPSPVAVWWLLKLKQSMRGRSVDLLVVSDLKLAMPGILAAKWNGIPVIFDLGENFAEATKVWARNDPPLKRLARSGPHVAWLEVTAARLADRVQVVVEDRIGRFLESGLDKQRIAVVSNTPIEVTPDSVVEPALQRRFAPRTHTALTLAYAGYLTEDRGLETAVSAITELNRELNTQAFRLLIVGDGRHKAQVEQASEAAVARGECKFFGWATNEQISDILLSVDVGIIPHWVNPFTNTTIPNKLFDYMNAGLPVVSSDMRPVANVLNTCRCGLVYNGTLEGLKVALRKMLDTEMRLQMSHNARRAVKERYNWAQDANTFLSSVAQLLADYYRE
jgi:glycosyltransferase involved in cell wall biosynthesis